MLELPNWPAWALRSFLALGLGTTILAGAKSYTESESGKKDATPSGEKLGPFKKFQFQYLVVYVVIMLADWLQGTNMYTLYKSYDVNIGALFMTGFTSSAIFGTFLGLYVDGMGRKKGILIYCVLEVIINLLEHVPNFWLLWVSRIMGGVSTSLLFTAFEAWMVSAHRRQGFPEEWLEDTFGKASSMNGIAAIVAGLIAQVAADKFGEIGPFQVAIALTILAFFLVLPWEENYGETDEKEGKKEEELTAWQCIRHSTPVCISGFVNSLFEGTMYTFVFMWVPTMLRILGDSPLPTGLVFSSFMVCITAGGLIFGIVLRYTSVEKCIILILVLQMGALVIPVFFQSLVPVFLSFLLYETGVGMYFPCGGMMRSKVIPDALQSSIMNIFRVPLNVLVVTGTYLTDAIPHSTVFSIITGWLFIATCLQLVMLKAAPESPKKGD